MKTADSYNYVCVWAIAKLVEQSSRLRIHTESDQIELVNWPWFGLDPVFHKD